MVNVCAPLRGMNTDEKDSSEVERCSYIHSKFAHATDMNTTWFGTKVADTDILTLRFICSNLGLAKLCPAERRVPLGYG